ncbi:Slfn3 [Phodopus roborovskii]|uniref:Slfn3 protein n=1 Tax=Phodopus roborovskii TaxID=109678 RepID=A0AAU9Z1Y3_PHORO|nr:Slfn3 [Phodopus roborovskii]
MKDTQLRKREAQSVSEAVCTLVNSGGGVVKAHISNSNYSFTRDGMGLDLENSFGNILPLSQKYLDYMKDKDYFLIFVKQWIPDMSGQRVLTWKTNFYVRSLSLSHELKAPDAVQFLKEKKYAKGMSGSRLSWPGSFGCDELQREMLAMFFNKEQLTYKETLCFTKSKYAEVKMCPKKKIKEKILAILPQPFSAFANTEGGYLFFGLDGDNQEVIGFEANENDLVHLESEIEECIRQLPVAHFCEEQEKIKYTCKFIQVHRQGAVFCCAVFTADPESWHVEGGRVKGFTAEEWVKRQMDSTPAVCRKVTCSPEALCMELCPEQGRYEQLLWTELASLRRGTLVTSKSWTLGPGLPEKQEVILDLLHISQDSLLTLHCFVLGDGELEDDSTVLNELGAKLKNYCKQTALTLKQMLVNLGGYTGKVGVVIKIVYLGHRAVSLYDSSSKISYPRTYYLTTKTVRHLEKALAEVVETVSRHKTIMISLP